MDENKVKVFLPVASIVGTTGVAVHFNKKIAELSEMMEVLNDEIKKLKKALRKQEKNNHLNGRTKTKRHGEKYKYSNKGSSLHRRHSRHDESSEITKKKRHHKKSGASHRNKKQYSSESSYSSSDEVNISSSDLSKESSLSNSSENSEDFIFDF